MNNELKAIRYMLNNLILRVWDLQQQVEIITRPKREYKISEPNIGGNDIAFDLFTLPRKKYEELIDKYGVDVITRACCKLDEFIKLNEYIPHRTASNALSRVFIKQVLIEERQSNIKSTQIKLEDVVDKETAIKYIESIPDYLSNIDENVKELRRLYGL